MDQTIWRTRTFVAGSFCFSVAADSEPVRDAVEALFADLSHGSEPGATFEIETRNGIPHLDGPDPLPIVRSAGSSTLTSDLVTAVNRQMLDAEDNRLHLHAGAVATETSGILISGPAGRGKTTLVASMALRGWRYLTDEAASIAVDDPCMRAFPKPLSVKSSGHGLIAELVGHHVTLGAEEGVWQVPVSSLGASTTTDALPTMIVVLLDRSEDATPTWAPLSPAETVVHLVEQSLDFDRYGDEALVVLARLCSQCTCVGIAAGTPAATAELVGALAEKTVRNEAPVTVERLTAGGTVDQSVLGVRVGEEVVVRHRHSGVLVSLNAAGADVWNRLSADDVDLEDLSEAEIEFARKMDDLGFVSFREAVTSSEGSA